MSIYYKNIGMKYIFYILIFCFPLSCNNTTSRLKPNNQSDIDTISITQGLKNQIEEFKLSDVVKEIEIIPLETCPKSIFKFIDNIIVTENDLFVNARISVLRFDRKTGLFINQIGSRGQGPEEFISCAGIGVNETLKNVYVFSSEDNRIQIYSFDGSFISSKQLLLKGKTTVGSQHEENRTYTFWGDKHMLRRMLPLSDGSKDFWSVFANMRIVAIFPQIIYFFGILYTAYFMITLYKVYLYNQNTLLKVFLILYYIGFIWSISVVKYTSPISYASGVIYNKIAHNEWIDTKTQINLKSENNYAKNR